jgi:hypothetical protein
LWILFDLEVQQSPLCLRTRKWHHEGELLRMRR